MRITRDEGQSISVVGYVNVESVTAFTVGTLKAGDLIEITGGEIEEGQRYVLLPCAMNGKSRQKQAHLSIEELAMRLLLKSMTAHVTCGDHPNASSRSSIFSQQLRSIVTTVGVS